MIVGRWKYTNACFSGGRPLFTKCEYVGDDGGNTCPGIGYMTLNDTMMTRMRRGNVTSPDSKTERSKIKVERARDSYQSMSSIHCPGIDGVVREALSVRDSRLPLPNIGRERDG